MQAIVEIAVRLTDRARLALAIWLIKLLVVPPGQAASTITPTAIYSGSEKTRHNKNAKMGNSTICPINPDSTAFGALSKREKS